MLRWIFCNCFSCSTESGTGLGGEGSSQDRAGSPCEKQEILRLTWHIQLHPGLQPNDGYLWQMGRLEWATSVLLNHCEGRFGTWPCSSWVSRAECWSMSQLMAFVAILFRRLVMFGHSLVQCPACLQIRHLLHVLSFRDSGFAIRLRKSVASIWACLISFLFSFSWALASPVLCF